MELNDDSLAYTYIAVTFTAMSYRIGNVGDVKKKRKDET